MPSDPITRESVSLEERWDGLGFAIRMSIRYHQRRVRFFDRWNATTNALVLLSGSAAVINLLTAWINQEFAIIIFSGLVSISALLDLVVGTARMARVHEILYRQFVDLERRWTAQYEPTEILLSELENEKLRLEQDEPPPLNTLVELCYNDTARAMGRSIRYVGITPFQRRMAQFLSSEDPSHKQQDIDAKLTGFSPSRQ